MELSFKFLIVIALSTVALIGSIYFSYGLLEFRDLTEEVPAPFVGESDSIVSVYPKQSNAGTIFFVSADILDYKHQNLVLSVVSGENRSFIRLYDDGYHFDREPNDGIYGGFFDSTNKQIGRYSVFRGDEELTNFNIGSESCELIVGNGASEDIDFVFLPSGYENYDDFKRDTLNLLTGPESLFEIEPFKTKKSSFSISLANSSRDLGCSRDCGSGPSTIVCCSDSIVQEVASQCHSDNIVVLLNDEDRCGSASSYSKICAKNAKSSLALVHELGHSFGGLSDEYVYEGYDIGAIDSVNCAASCDSWGDLSDECYEGCTYSSLYRSTEDSIMRSLIPEFNLVSEVHLSSLIENYKGKILQVERALPEEKGYHVSFSADQESFDVSGVSLLNRGVGVLVSHSEYSAKLIDSSGFELLEVSIPLSFEELPLPGSAAVPIAKENVESSFNLPYSSEAERLQIYRSNELIQELPLGSLSEDRCGDSICQEYENALSCAVDCNSEEDNFCQSTICDPDCGCDQFKRTTYFALAILLFCVALLGFYLVFRLFLPV